MSIIGQRVYKQSGLTATSQLVKALVFTMISRLFFPVFILLVLFQVGNAVRDNNKSPSACHCSPVISVGVNGNGQCDLCEGNNQLLQEVKDLKNELAEIKSQINQIRPGKKKKLAMTA